MAKVHAVTGISDHIGWANFVTVGVRNRQAVVLDRRRFELIGRGFASAPYHHEGLKLPIAEVEKILSKTQSCIDRLCRSALQETISMHGIKQIILQESPLERLPRDLPEVLASYKITCAADGMMYRESLARIAAELGLKVSRYSRKSDPIRATAEALGVTHTALTKHLTALGNEVGIPWQKEHRIAAANALRILAATTKVRLICKGDDYGGTDV